MEYETDPYTLSNFNCAIHVKLCQCANRENFGIDFR